MTQHETLKHNSEGEPIYLEYVYADITKIFLPPGPRQDATKPHFILFPVPMQNSPNRLIQLRHFRDQWHPVQRCASSSQGGLMATQERARVSHDDCPANISSDLSSLNIMASLDKDINIAHSLLNHFFCFPRICTGRVTRSACSA